MPLTALAETFKEQLFPLPSTETLLNPYSYFHPSSDLPDAPFTRQQNLLNYLTHFERNPHILIVGEAPGPWGCRFSGVPFTSERQLADGDLPFSGAPTSTLTPPAAERSATIFWGALKTHHQDFLAWNSIPLLPHKPGEPNNLRPPTKTEILTYQFILADIIEQLKPEEILAVGRRAEQAIQLLGEPCSYVRHPSRGGKRAFLKFLVDFFDSGFPNFGSIAL
jgi:hypothetical protein